MSVEHIVLFIGLLPVCLIVFGITLLAIDLIRGSSLSCKFMGWHNGKGSSAGFDGCSFQSTCSKCGHRVLQDSQGNWFR